MANVDVPVQDLGQNPFIYGFGARPIQQPKADQSGEIRGKAVGSALGEAGRLTEAGTKLAFGTESQAIKEEMHSQYDPVQNNFISRLLRVDDVLKKTGDPDNLINNYSGKYPADIQKLPGTVDQLISMRDNGRVDQSYVDMQKDAIAKNLRAKYGSGMRDVIDGEFARMTREDPANKVIAQLTDNINAYAAQAKAAKDKLGNVILQAVKDGHADPALYFNYQKNPGTGPAALQSIYSQAKVRADLQLDDLKMTNQIKHNQLSKETATQNNDDMLGKELAASFDKIHVQIPGMQASNVSEALTYIYEHPQDPNIEAESRTLSTIIAGARDSYIAQMTQKGNQPFDPNDPNSHTRASIQGSKDYQSSIQEHAKMFEGVVKNLSDKDYGAAYATINNMHARIDAVGSRLLDVHPEYGIIGALNKIAPQYVGTMVTNVLGEISKLDDPTKAYVINGVGTAVAPPPQATSSGVNFNLGTALDQAANKGAAGPEFAVANSAIISGVHQVLIDNKAPLPIRENAANFLYGDPTVADKINDSQVRQGQITPGKSTFLASTVNSQTTQAVKKLGNPETTQKYVEFAKKSVGLTLRPEIEQLSRIAANPQFQIGYDTTNDQFFVHANLTPEQRRMGIRAPQEMGAVQDSVKKINLALRSLNEVNAKLLHEDTKDFLAQFFIESGMDPQVVKNTIGGQFIEALINANRPKVEPVRE